MDPVVALTMLHGAAPAGVLRELGVERTAVIAALKRRTITRIGHAKFALPGASHVRRAAVAHGALATCVTALADAGLPARADDGVHGWAKPGAHVSGPLRWHRSSEFTALDVGDIGTALDLALGCVPLLDHLVLVDSALNCSGIGSEWTPRTGESATRDWIRRMRDAGAGSPGETLARVALVLGGLTVATQVRFEGVGFVDLLVGGKVVVEIDGRAYHQDPAAFRRDRERDRVLAALGYPVLRYAFTEVLEPGWDPVHDVESVAWRQGIALNRASHPQPKLWDSLRRASNWSDASELHRVS